MRTMQICLTLLLCGLTGSVLLGQTPLLEIAKEKAPAGKNKKAVEALITEGITGENHQKQIGKIVFSNQEITRQVMNNPTTEFKSEFTLGDEIWGRAFINSSPVQTLLEDGSINVLFDGGLEKCGFISSITIDGVEKTNRMKGGYQQFTTETKLGDKYVTTFPLTVYKVDIFKPHIYEMLDNLSIGKHKVRFEIFGSEQKANEPKMTKTPLAVGEFTLVVPEPAKRKYGKNFNSVKQAIVDPAIEAMIVQAANAHAQKMKWRENFVAARITSPEWTLERDKYTNALIGRVISAAVMAQHPDGLCTYQIFSFIQEYDGKDYVNYLKYNSMGNQVKIDCQ